MYMISLGKQQSAVNVTYFRKRAIIGSLCCVCIWVGIQKVIKECRYISIEQSPSYIVMHKTWRHRQWLTYTVIVSKRLSLEYEHDEHSGRFSVFGVKIYSPFLARICDAILRITHNAVYFVGKKIRVICWWDYFHDDMTAEMIAKYLTCRS